MAWYEKSVFYQIYPLGLCGAPWQNDGVRVDRISRLTGWIPHLQKLGVDAVYFSPVFESDTHGYNTRDYTKIDCRLGDNAAFASVCRALHDAGIRVVLDGVFNHVGRGFWAFQDLLRNRAASPYAGWFHVSFEGNSSYNDGLWYEGWEGNYDLVKLTSTIRRSWIICSAVWRAGSGNLRSMACGWMSPTCCRSILSAVCGSSATAKNRSSSWSAR